jgi:hypothetical protein
VEGEGEGEEEEEEEGMEEASMFARTWEGSGAEGTELEEVLSDSEQQQPPQQQQRQQQLSAARSGLPEATISTPSFPSSAARQQPYSLSAGSSSSSSSSSSSGAAASAPPQPALLPVSTAANTCSGSSGEGGRVWGEGGGLPQHGHFAGP